MTMKINEVEKEVTIYLRDYLCPGELYPYHLLPVHLEDWLNKGYQVSLISVPGFVMFTGLPGYKKPWGAISMGKLRQFKTAYEALRGV